MEVRKEDQRDPDEKVVEIEIERLRDFKNHPFKVQADSQMKELQKSIKKYGILNPLIVRPRPEGFYEIISGHRRKYAAQQLKYTKVAGHAIGQKIHPTEGKQSVKTLISQGQGVSTIPLADEGLKDFQKIAKKYGVDFAVVKDKNSEPPIYTIFFKAKDQDAITRILDDYAAKQIKKPSVKKTSVLEKLKKFKEIVAAIPKKVLSMRGLLSGRWKSVVSRRISAT